ncbi:hypothetical protein H1N96_gp07 [Escherichia phage PGN590]|uniref:Uncharacterized protein n=1 Tax=Escherichia phage PGN590 TaxID=2714735 RepID=A0A6M9ED69_9CAUD|nr:hypothetical protein H1N96_gp07 [Escherichia phage PGN590]QKL16930.1 hypothetical protein [Escherichia phage PGN590]
MFSSPIARKTSSLMIVSLRLSSLRRMINASYLMPLSLSHLQVSAITSSLRPVRITMANPDIHNPLTTATVLLIGESPTAALLNSDQLSVRCKSSVGSRCKRCVPSDKVPSRSTITIGLLVEKWYLLPQSSNSYFFIIKPIN